MVNLKSVLSKMLTDKTIIVRRSNRFSSYALSPLALPVVAAFSG